MQKNKLFAEEPFMHSEEQKPKDYNCFHRLY